MALAENAYPDRLDLPVGTPGRRRTLGVRFAIDGEAHFTGHLGYLRYGVGRAVGLADPGRRDQHLAAVQAAGIPAERPLDLTGC